MFVSYIERNTPNKKLYENLHAELGLPIDFAKLLVQRGISSVDDVKSFLNPDISNMQNPFAIDGMDDAKLRIEKAIKNQEKVVIYGDYDCDGICAISILYLYLEKLIKNLNYYMPNRHEDGYGLHKTSIDLINSKFTPDLIITVDCGITSVDEIEFAKKIGIDVIVTDHHEPREIIPNCIIVNPKVKKQGFYDYCGAGVALKLVEALGGRDTALEYIDIAALATIADIVPLVNENRFIAKMGLEKFNQSKRLVNKLFLRLLKLKSINSGDVMFKIAPRINASGRMGDATSVVNAFIGKNERDVKNVLVSINKDNQARQKLCDKTISDIMEKIKNYDLINNRIIIMYDKKWDSGILGIAAAKLSELFHRPVLLFNETDGILKGSARSIFNINIFECLNNFANYFMSFGGHSAACGVTMERANFDEFFKKIINYMNEKFDYNYFYPNLVYDLKLNDDNCTFEFLKYLKLLEPIGYGNSEPIFLIENCKDKFARLGKTNHIKLKQNDFEIIGFNLYPNLESVNCVNDLTVTLSENIFRGKKSIQGIIKKILIKEPSDIDEEFIAFSYIRQLLLPKCEQKRPIIRINEPLKRNDNSIFGNLYIAFSTKTYYNFIKENKSNIVFYNIIRTENINPYDRIVLSPDDKFDFHFYKNIVLLDKPLTDNYIYWLQNQTNANIYLASDNQANIENVKKFRCKNADEYYDIYKKMKWLGTIYIDNVKKLSKRLGIKEYPYFKTLTAIYIFIELGMINITKDFKIVFRKNKAQIENSKIYNTIINL